MLSEEKKHSTSIKICAHHQTSTSYTICPLQNTTVKASLLVDIKHLMKQAFHLSSIYTLSVPWHFINQLLYFLLCYP